MRAMFRAWLGTARAAFEIIAVRVVSLRLCQVIITRGRIVTDAVKANLILIAQLVFAQALGNIVGALSALIPWKAVFGTL